MSDGWLIVLGIGLMIDKDWAWAIGLILLVAGIA